MEGPMAVMNWLDQFMCARCACTQFSLWKINVRGGEDIDLRPSSTWCEEMSTTWTDSEQFSAAI